MTHPVHTLRRGVVHVARAEAVYPSLEAGSVALVISDGPYGLSKAAWDRQRGEDGLREWYRPHVEAWGRLCAPAASVYVWGTDDSASALRPLMREFGWTKRERIVWDKQRSIAAMNPAVRPWANMFEVCDYYTRGTPHAEKIPGALGNVWRTDLSSRDSETLKSDVTTYSGPVGTNAIHPCQKPLAFSDRIIRASSRPGDLVLEPFGGTLRAAVACERMPEREARRYCCIEMDEDGRGYVPAALASIGYGEAVEVEQVPLW